MNIEQMRKEYRGQYIPVIRTETGKFLEGVVKELNPKRILEFGTAVGVSAITMLNASTAKIVTVEIDKDRASEAEENLKQAGLASRASIIVGDALAVAEDLVKNGETFDFVFLDSSKGQYPKLLPYILKLLEDGGTMVADDVLFFGYVYGEPPKKHRSTTYRLREFIEMCENESAFESVEIKEIEDGILIAKKTQKLTQKN
ncbi:MAG: O-methyltransferase [Clostridia bacterium]|nr:O-methyltransferase [Clostridia bacterium]